MSQQSESLLWINKDATNVHRKKHVAEVNAHVQKRASKGRTLRRLNAPKKTLLPARKASSETPSLPSPGAVSTFLQPKSDGIYTDVDSFRTTSPSVKEEDLEYTPISTIAKIENPAALIFSSYLEEESLTWDSDTSQAQKAEDSGDELAMLLDQLGVLLPSAIDASNPLPGLLSNLTSHDKMLLHTHLTYMPQVYYGLSNRAAYCPIRTASVSNMLREPIGSIWVFIALEMYIETVRKSNTRKNTILKRKTQAYHLMSKALQQPRTQANEVNLLLAPVAAAIAEMFCGDPIKALTHLNGIDAFITARGGMEYIRQMEPTISMPVFAVSAYRTLLQDNLTTMAAFDRARNCFLDTLRSLISWNKYLQSIIVSGYHAMQHPLSHDEGFDGNFDIADGLLELQTARERIFLNHPLLRKFVSADLECLKPGEKIDHFIILFNLNRVLADHGTNFKQATHFIYGFVDDVENGGSSKDAKSSINVSGVLRLLTNRQTKMNPHQPSAGVVRAWDALDALEIMKLLDQEMKGLVCQTLHTLLVGHVQNAMSEDDLHAIDTAMNNRWTERHSSLSLPHR